MTLASSSPLTMIQRFTRTIPSQSSTRQVLVSSWRWLSQRVRQPVPRFTAVSAASTAVTPYPLSSATRSASTMYPAHPSVFPSLASQQHRLQLRKVGNNNPFTKVTEFVLDLDDAKAYLYKDSTKHRIHRWQDLKVNIYV